MQGRLKLTTASQLSENLRDGLALAGVNVGKQYIAVVVALEVDRVLRILLLHGQVCTRRPLQIRGGECAAILTSDISAASYDHGLQLLRPALGHSGLVWRKGHAVDCIPTGGGVVDQVVRLDGIDLRALAA